jgi:hypothetical protein
MNVEYVPLLPVLRELYNTPRGRDRFREYLATMLTADRSDIGIPPLVIVNPMGRDHVSALLDALLAVDADEQAAHAVGDAATDLADIPGDFKASLIIADDLKGGWTNRYAVEYDQRRLVAPVERTARQTRRFWITGILWSSEPASVEIVRQSILIAVYRAAYVQQHGTARTLRELMTQEGMVMARAGCTEPTLDEEDLAYTREVLSPLLDAGDMRTGIECLFGDAAGRTLSFTPRGLSPRAGLALALHDARVQNTV